MQISASTYCSMEAATSKNNGPKPRRRRPPVFGTTIPKITTRGLVTTNNDDGNAIPDVADREDCPLCKKFGSGPCGEVFKRWLTCTDKNPGKDASGEPLHLTKCSDFAETLAECLEENSEYYSKDDNNINDQDKKLDSSEKNGQLKDSWKDFVNEMEDSIASGKYDISPFPESIKPKVEVRLATRTGAAFFMPVKEGQPLIAAYILDDDGNVIAAGSKDDMDMGGLGCVLQFNASKGMKAATSRAIYDTESDGVAVFSRMTLLPEDK